MRILTLSLCTLLPLLHQASKVSAQTDISSRSGEEFSTTILVAEMESISADLPISINEQFQHNRDFNSVSDLLVQSETPSLEPELDDVRFEPDLEEIRRLQNDLEDLESLEYIERENKVRYSPSLSIANPTGFGGDRGQFFLSVGYQADTRFGGDGQDDGGLGIGVAFGNATKAVGVELSYTLASFGSNRDFGTGGFNAKIHHRAQPSLGFAVGWNGFVTLGDDVDFDDSVYGSISKIIRTRDDINKPFSRIGLTAGLGSGQFRTEEAILDDDGGIGVFGSVAFRVARPASVIVEWTGQDLAAGISVVPFADFPLVITPAVRDITGAGDGARFVFGAGLAFGF